MLGCFHQTLREARTLVLAVPPKGERKHLYQQLVFSTVYFICNQYSLTRKPIPLDPFTPTTKTNKEKIGEVSVMLVC